jgi:hypothetical protein
MAVPVLGGVLLQNGDVAAVALELQPLQQACDGAAYLARVCVG